MIESFDFLNVSSTTLINAFLSEIPTIETFGALEVEAVTTIPVGVILESSTRFFNS